MNEAKLDMLGDRVLVRRAEAEETTPGGLVLPDQTRELERPRRGTVVAVGPGRVLLSGQRSPIDLAAGDVVHYRRHAGEQLTVGGQEYVILSEDEVHCREAR